MIHRIPQGRSLGDWDAGRLMGYFDRENTAPDRPDDWRPLLRKADVPNINQL